MLLLTSIVAVVPVVFGSGSKSGPEIIKAQRKRLEQEISDISWKSRLFNIIEYPGKLDNLFKKEGPEGISDGFRQSFAEGIDYVIGVWREEFFDAKMEIIHEAADELEPGNPGDAKSLVDGYIDRLTELYNKHVKQRTEDETEMDILIKNHFKNWEESFTLKIKKMLNGRTYKTKWFHDAEGKLKTSLEGEYRPRWRYNKVGNLVLTSDAEEWINRKSRRKERRRLLDPNSLQHRRENLKRRRGLAQKLAHFEKKFSSK